MKNLNKICYAAGLVVLAAAGLLTWHIMHNGNAHNSMVGAGLKPVSTSTGAEIDAAAIKSGANQNWLAQVQARIAAEEYQVKAGVKGVLQAPNRKQNLRAYFKRNGVEVGPRAESRGSVGAGHALPSESASAGQAKKWKFLWQTEYFGRQGALKRVKPAEPEARGARVEYTRQDISEWYTNEAQGIEQGFVIHNRPKGSVCRHSGESRNPEKHVCIIAQPVTGLILKLTEDKKAIEMRDANQAVVMRYDQLKVVDARNKSLRAGMRVENNCIVLTYNDNRAEYPVYIDPLMTTPAWTAESDHSGEYFGWSVSSAGDVNGDGYGDVICGAHCYDNGQPGEGRAYVYLGSAGGLGTTADWTAESDQANALFGRSVGSAGDVNGDGYGDVICGAYWYDNGETDEGRAYVYLGSAGGLSATPAWTAESDQTGAIFSFSVGSAGDVNGDGYGDVICGADSYDNGESNEGRAYVYLGSAGGLSTTPAWTAESDQANAQFGRSVGSAGDVNGDGYGDVICGAHLYDNGHAGEGRAYVYLGSAGGLAAAPAWTAESDQASAYFGRSVGSAGDVNGDGYGDVIVGADQYDNGQAGEGRAHVYLGSMSGLGTTPAWIAESDQASAYFGRSVGSAGDVNGDGYGDVICGAHGYDNGQADEGRAYVYLGSAGGLGAIPSWTVESDQGGAWFGDSAGSAGDVNGDGYGDVIVGAHCYDNGQANEGRAYVYLGSAGGLNPASAWIAESDQASAWFGHSVGSAGDLNGDGYGDVICGAHGYDNGQANEGQAYVYLGSISGLGTTPAWREESDQASAWFGVSAGSAGDVNGDGYGDVICGAYCYDNGQVDEGQAYVYLGSASGLSTTPAWKAESGQASAWFGCSVSSAGDVNGDGYGDVIVGAHGYDNGQADEGQAYVYMGSAGGLGATAAWTAESDQAGANFGISATSAGDVNGDGYGDVIVGAHNYDIWTGDEGRVYVYLGSASGLNTTPAWTAESGQASAYFGRSVGSAGDINGDGYGDVIVGAYEYDNGQTDEGRAYVYVGSISGLGTTPAWTAESDQDGAYFGRSVGSAGDVNGDGYGDVICGAYEYDNGQSNEGQAYVYLGTASGLSATPAWTAESNQVDAWFGYSVGSAGDVNGDGYGDVICGALNYDNGQAYEGQAYVYYGNEFGGLSVRPRQVKADGASLIGPACAASYSPSNTQARIRLWARSSQGRTRARLQVDTALPGTGFMGSNLQTGASYQDIGVSGMDMELLLTGLNPMQAYRWRVRLLYDPSNAPYGLLHSPWYSLCSGYLEGEHDFRTGPWALPTATPTYTPVNTPAIPGGRFSFRIYNPVVRVSHGESASIIFELEQAESVHLRIYNITGRLMHSSLEYYNVGRHEIIWNGSGNAGSGTYLVYFEAGRHKARGKIVLVR